MEAAIAVTAIFSIYLLIAGKIVFNKYFVIIRRNDTIYKRKIVEEFIEAYADKENTQLHFSKMHILMNDLYPDIKEYEAAVKKAKKKLKLAKDNLKKVTNKIN